MTTCILDTDTIIFFLRGEEKIVHRFAARSAEELGTTIVSQAELLYGAYYSGKKKRNMEKVEAFLKEIPVLPFCSQSSRMFARQKAHLKKKGNLLPDLDLMIAGICLAHDLPLVTNNTRHFQRIKGLKLENWME